MRRWHRQLSDKSDRRGIPFRLGAVFLCLLPSFFVLLAAGCAKEEVKAVTEKVVNVRAATVEKKSFRPSVETIGSLAPDQEVFVSSEVDGVVKSVKVDEGMAVDRGAVLAEVNETDYKLDMQRAKAALHQTEATLENTRVEHQRKSSLFKEELITRQQFDDVSTRLVLAEAEVERAKATVALAEQRFEKTRIRSPLAGFIKDKRISAGDFVRASSPTFVIIRNNPLKLHFTVAEKDVGKLRTGQEVSFNVDAFPQRTFQGRLNRVSPNLDEKTRTIEVEAMVPNPGNILKPGFFARVTLYTGPPRDIVVVPTTSILYDDSRTRVFVVERDKAKQKEVKIGNKIDEMMEITEGLKTGEQIVIVGQNNLVEGVKVNVAR